MTARLVCGGEAAGPVLASREGLSFWGGVDPDTGRIIDVHHPDCGAGVSGKVLLMPTSRGSCSGSGVLLQLSLAGLAPAALVFREDEEVLTLGALVSDRIFDRPITVLRLGRDDYADLARAPDCAISAGTLRMGKRAIALHRVSDADLALSEADRACLDGRDGPAARLAMEVLCRMAASNGATALLDVTRGHIDGCILAHDANLIFAERMADLGARVAVPTTINAISVDRRNWQAQGVAQDFGSRASRLADAYVRMGAQPTFTCAPYLLDERPAEGERIGWSESNAVLYANSVLGARTPKHPDYLDLFIAMTGRAPAAGVYTDEGRRARAVIEVEAPGTVTDESFWAVLGWQAGRLAPDRIPLLRGVAHLAPGPDDLKAMCAAFATTSGAPMLHVEGVTPEAHLAPVEGATVHAIGAGDMAAAWSALNRGADGIDLVAIGSPHASARELGRIVSLLDGRRCRATMIVTIGRDELARCEREGLAQALRQARVRLIPDLCWCSITEPVFPANTRGLMTNSGKYAHYAHGLSGLHARLGGLADCVEAAVTGRAPEAAPDWARGD